MNKIKNLIKKYPYISIIIIALTIILGIILFSGDGNSEGEIVTESNTRTVQTLPVSNFASGAVGLFAPTAAGNSFVVRAENGGRVESVSETGVKVTKGEILARLENSSQLAALTQAQGSYESAVASAAQSSFSVDSQQESVVSSYNTANTVLRSTLISVQGVMENTVDEFFTDRNRQSLDLNDIFWEKKLIDYALDDWGETVGGTVAGSQVVTELDIAIAVTERVANMLDYIFNNVLSEENGASTEYGATLSGYKSSLTTVKSTIATNLQTLKNTRLDVIDAESSLKRAESSSLGGNTSAEEARIKQALGSVQAAQSAYEKTIVRAPFAGTISSLNVSMGDIINLGTDIAIIVPEDQAETEQSFNLPLSAVKYTPTGAFVFTIDDDGYLVSTEVNTGLVTTNSVNVTGLTGSEIIVEDVRGLKAGEKVTIK